MAFLVMAVLVVVGGGSGGGGGGGGGGRGRGRGGGEWLEEDDAKEEMAEEEDCDFANLINDV